MKKRQQISSMLLAIGLLTILIIAIMPLVGMTYSWLKYIYAIGAAMTFIARILERYEGKNLTIRRLYRIQVVSAVCYCASAVLLFYSSSEKDWLAFLTSGAVLQLYTTFRLQSEEKKEAKKGNKN